MEEVDVDDSTVEEILQSVQSKARMLVGPTARLPHWFCLEKNGYWIYEL